MLVTTGDTSLYNQTIKIFQDCINSGCISGGDEDTPNDLKFPH